MVDYRLSVLDPETMPKTDAWSRRLLALPAVKESVVDEFEDLFIDAMERNGSYSLIKLAA